MPATYHASSASVDSMAAMCSRVRMGIWARLGSTKGSLFWELGIGRIVQRRALPRPVRPRNTRRSGPARYNRSVRGSTRGIGALHEKLRMRARGTDPWLVLAIALGTLARAWSFGDPPPGFNQDEASTAYDAWALLHFGVDRNGIHNPAVLVSWGSGMYVLAALVEMPSLWLLGPSVFSARLAFLLLGIASIPLLYLLLRESWDPVCARIGALLLAISPWHVMASRWALDCNLFPFVFLLATLCLVRSYERPRWLLAACLLYALCLYSYGTAYAVVPLFLFIVLGQGVRHRRWSWPLTGLATGASAVLALPILLFLLVNELEWRPIEMPFLTIPRLTGTPRYETVANVDALSPAFWQTAWENLGKGWRLLATQDDGLIWNAIPAHGVIYVFSSGFAIVGFFLLCGRVRQGREAALPLLAWCLVALALGALVPLNVNRANIAAIPLISCTAIALRSCWDRRAVAVGLSVVYALSFLGFLTTYFGSYRADAAPAFFASFDEAIRFAAAETDGEVCVTDDVNMPYIFTLFFTQEDPRVFRDTVVYEDPGAEFQAVVSYGRFRFGLDRCMPGAETVIAARDELERYDFSGYDQRSFERYTVFTRRTARRLAPRRRVG